jgi:hypothetical protein
MQTAILHACYKRFGSADTAFCRHGVAVAVVIVVTQFIVFMQILI